MPSEDTSLECACCGCGCDARNYGARRGVLFSRHGVEENVMICNSCTRYCDNCGRNYATQIRWFQNDCPSCYDDSDNNSCDEDDGFYYPSTKFFGRGPKYFGLELETEVTSGTRVEKLSVLHSILGSYSSLKDDGSLDYGIEIATQPASMDVHRENLGKLFAEMPSGLRSYSRSSCGLHVHVSRAPLGDLCIAKTVCFVNANHNRRFIRLMAGRASNSYCKVLPKKMGSAAKYNSDRYEAVNLQNDYTIEFRLFKGTLRQASVFKALEFTDALTNYAGKAARSIRDSQSRVKFCAFVEENSSDWPNLCAFIQARWFGRETDLTKEIGFEARENSQENLDQTTEQ